MRPVTIFVAISLAAFLVGCPGRKNVECVDSTNCDLHPGGVCTTVASGNQWCAYPDTTCPSGMRYSDVDIGDGLSGVCVAQQIDAGVDALDAGIDVPADVMPPTVMSVTPLDQSVTAGTGAAVTATFSEPILAASANASTFRVQAGAVAVPGSIVTNGALVSFMPQVRFSPSTTYQVTLTTGITDLAGNPLAQQYQWSFQTSVGGWTAAALLETEINKQADGLVTSFAGGRGIAAWSMTDCTPTCAGSTANWFAEYSSGVWSTAAAIPALNGAGVNAVVSDSQGRFTMILRRPGAANYLEASRYDGAAWSPPTLLETDDTANVSRVRAAADSAGNVAVTWNVEGTGIFDVWANRYVVGTGWTGAVRLETSTAPALYSAVAAHDGTATAVWIQNGMLMASRFAAGTGWSTAVPVGAATGNQPEVAYAGDSVPTVIWTDGTNLRASRFIGAWSQPTTINGASGMPFGALSLAASASTGRCVALWLAGPTGFQSVYQAVYTPGTGWGTVTSIDALGGAANYPAVVFGQGEQALAAWTQPQGAAGSPTGAWSNLFGPAVGWGDPQLISNDGMANVTDLQPFYDSTTNTFGAVWLKTTTNPRSVYQSRLQ